MFRFIACVLLCLAASLALAEDSPRSELVSQKLSGEPTIRDRDKHLAGVLVNKLRQASSFFETHAKEQSDPRWVWQTRAAQAQLSSAEDLQSRITANDRYEPREVQAHYVLTVLVEALVQAEARDLKRPDSAPMPKPRGSSQLALSPASHSADSAPREVVQTALLCLGLAVKSEKIISLGNLPADERARLRMNIALSELCIAKQVLADVDQSQSVSSKRLHAVESMGESACALQAARLAQVFPALFQTSSSDDALVASLLEPGVMDPETFRAWKRLFLEPARKQPGSDALSALKDEEEMELFLIWKELFPIVRQTSESLPAVRLSKPLTKTATTARDAEAEKLKSLFSRYTSGQVFSEPGCRGSSCPCGQ